MRVCYMSFSRLTASELSARFHALDADTLSALRDRSEEQHARASAELIASDVCTYSIDTNLTPYAIGDKKYPVAKEHILPSSHLAGTCADAWQRDVSSVVSGAMEVVHDPEHNTTCELLWGVGNCESRMTAADKSLFAAINTVIKNLVYMEATDGPIGGVGDKLVKPEAFFLEFDHGVRHDLQDPEEVRGMLLILVANFLNPLE